jgi:hypothetical protein
MLVRHGVRQPARDSGCAEIGCRAMKSIVRGDRPVRPEFSLAKLVIIQEPRGLPDGQWSVQ